MAHSSRAIAPSSTKNGPRGVPFLSRLLQQRIRELRSELITLLGTLREPQLERTGSHPILGELSIPQWLEFFLLHEAHHLYAILFELRAQVSF